MATFVATAVRTSYPTILVCCYVTHNSPFLNVLPLPTKYLENLIWNVYCFKFCTIYFWKCEHHYSIVIIFPSPTTPPLLNRTQRLDTVTSFLRLELNSLFRVLLQLPFPWDHVEGYMSYQEFYLLEFCDYGHASNLTGNFYVVKYASLCLPTYFIFCQKL
jgi:hypothetical protein